MYSLQPETAAEFHVARCLRADRLADFGDVPDSRPGEKTIRATFLRAMVVARLSDPSIAPTGIEIIGAIIDGDLICRGLASAGDPLPDLNLSDCRIRGVVDLSGTCWTSVNIDRCTLCGLSANGMRVDGSLFARDLVFDFAAPVAIDLDVEPMTTIDFEGLVVGSNVLLNELGRSLSQESDGFGSVCLQLNQCRIGGSLVLSGASLRNADGLALNMQFGEVTGAVFMDARGGHRFRAVGSVDFLGARIGGRVTCDGASLANEKGVALMMDGAEIKGGLTCNEANDHPFSAKGGVSLSATRIGISLNLVGAQLENSSGSALIADNAEVIGNVYLAASARRRFEASGAVSLRYAKIFGVFNCTGAHFEGPAADADTRQTAIRGDALVVDGAEVTGGVLLRSSDEVRFEAKGRVSLSGARLGGELNCSGASFDNEDGIAFTIEGTEVQGGVYLRTGAGHRFEARGQVSLLDARIAGALDCSGANFMGMWTAGTTGEQPARARGMALSLERADVTGGVFLRATAKDWLDFSGTINLYGAKIGVLVECVARITSAQDSLRFDMAVIRGRLKVHLAQGSLGEVSLRGTQVEELDDNGGDGWDGRVTGQYDSSRTNSVVLKLDGFTYQRFGEWSTRPNAPTGFGHIVRIARRMAGKGMDHDIWWRRAKWLDRQCIRVGPDEFFPQPHEQLARILRLTGHAYDARRIAIHRFEHERRCRADSVLSRPIIFLYRWLFGCGYLPVHALVTVLAWLLLGWVGVSHAIDLNESRNVVFVRSTTGVDIVRTLSRPEEAPRMPSQTGPYDRFDTRDIACDEVSPLLYALDTMLPVFQLHTEEKCEFTNNTRHGRWWRFGKAAYALIGWILVTLAALTWTGVLRKDAA